MGIARTNENLVKFVKTRVGCPYWFGCYGQLATEKLYKAKKKQYPKYYKYDYSSYSKDFGKQRVVDCAGLIKQFLWVKSFDNLNVTYNRKEDYGATGFYNKAKKKGKISTFPKTAGMLLFKGNAVTKTHVGVYIGDGRVVEAIGHNYGVKETKFSDKWTYWAQCHLIKDVEPTPTPEPTPTVTTKHVKAKSGLWLHNTESTAKSTRICCMPYGSEFIVERTSGAWSYGTYKDGNRKGYCYSTYLI